MYFKRDLAKIIAEYAKFPVVALLGPRQSGKTTLAKEHFKNHVFVSLEEPAMRTIIIQDPKKFFTDNENEHGIIIDEFQYIPELLSYIQVISDEKKRPGYFVITGSQNYLMNQAITQSLAGRVGILTLLPLSIKELQENDLITTPDQVIFYGGYPRVYEQQILPINFYPSYMQSYVERDVRQLEKVGDLTKFQLFMRLCAGRIGQLLNISDIAMNCGIDRRTAEQWLSVLQAGYVLFLLQPYFSNYNKRLTKTPKIYFYDTGLACSLLGISSAKELSTSFFRGQLFESLIIADLHKQYFNEGRLPRLYFWRDMNGRIEVDCIVDKAMMPIPVEIKSGQTMSQDFFKGIDQWSTLAKTDPEKAYVVYAGDMSYKTKMGRYVTWQQAGSLLEVITQADNIDESYFKKMGAGQEE